MKITLATLTMLATLALTGCGSDDGQTGVSGNITGVAATGNAISGGIVTLKCANGSTVSTTTTVSGNYVLQADRLTLPCLAQVSFNDSYGSPYTLHSYVSAIGTTNITPLTELLTAVLLQHQPSDIFANINSNAFQMLSKGDPVAAWATVRTSLQSQGILLPENFDPVHELLRAKSDTQSGNGHDQLLDAAGLQLNLSYGSNTDIGLTLAMGGSNFVRVNNLHWGVISTGSPIYPDSNTLPAQQFSQYYSVDAAPEKTLAEAASSQSLAGTHNGSLPEGESCSFQINADGSVLLLGSGDTIDHLIASSAFLAARAPAQNVWSFSEGDDGGQGFLFLSTPSTDDDRVIGLWLYEREKPTIKCTAPLTNPSPT